MRLVIQRVNSASVTVNNQLVSSIGPGLMTLVGLHQDDTVEDLEYCCKRLIGCKLFANTNGASWKHSVKQRDYEILCVSQFTLYGSLSSKHSTDFSKAMKTDKAKEMYAQFLQLVGDAYAPEKIKDGVFGAMMDVALVNDGPVTLIVDSLEELKDRRKLQST